MTVPPTPPSPPDGFAQQHNSPTPYQPDYGAAPYPYGQPPPGYGPPPPGYGHVPRKTSALAIASLVVSVLGLVLCLPLLVFAFVSAFIPLAAVVLGLIALFSATRSGEGGRGIAIAAVLLGALGMIPGLLALIPYLVLMYRP